MITTIQKWGNSQGIRIPKSILETVDWKENEAINLFADDDRIVIEKANKRKSIEELFENFNGEYEPTEFDWGKPVGNEIW